MSAEFPPVQSTQTLVVPTTASTTTYGSPFQLQFPGDWIVIVATLTAGSASTLGIWLQESWDGGTTWTDIVAFKQLAAAATLTYRLVAAHTASSSGTTVVAGSPAVVTSGTAALAVPTLVGATGSNGVALDGPWGPLLRIVSTTGTGTNSATVTQTLKIISVQQSH
jgi:hypothetical protein